MTYLLDTDWVISLLNGPRKAVELVRKLMTEGVELSIITYGEIYEGLLNERSSPERLAEFDEFAATVQFATMDVEVARSYGKIRSLLRAQGLLIPDNDLWIAATALTQDLTLVSRDEHFARVPGLKLYKTK